MLKFSIKTVAAAALVTASLPVLAASSGSSGSTSGASGSAGLGIDYAALAVVSGTGNPSISLHDDHGDTMGGPANGIRKHFARRRK